VVSRCTGRPSHSCCLEPKTGLFLNGTTPKKIQPSREWTLRPTISCSNQGKGVRWGDRGVWIFCRWRSRAVAMAGRFDASDQGGKCNACQQSHGQLAPVVSVNCSSGNRSLVGNAQEGPGGECEHGPEENGAPPAKTDPRPNRQKKTCRISQGKQAVGPNGATTWTNCAQRATYPASASKGLCRKITKKRSESEQAWRVPQTGQVPRSPRVPRHPIMYGTVRPKAAPIQDRCRADLVRQR